jgi:hypothetical protein
MVAVRLRRAAHVPSPGEIHVEHALPLDALGLFETGHMEHTRGIDEPVDAAERLCRGVDRLRDRVRIGDIADKARRNDPAPRNFEPEGSRSSMATAAPSPAKRAAIAAPMPEPAPVMTILRPTRRSMRTSLAKLEQRVCRIARCETIQAGR